MIEKVKKATIGFLKEDLNIILSEIQKASCFMVIKQEDNANTSLSNDGVIDKIDHTIKNLESYIVKKPLFGDYLVSNIEELDGLKSNDVESLSKEIDALLDQKLELKKDIKEKNDIIKSLDPWIKLSVPLNELKDTTSTIFNIGFIETRSVNDFTSLMNEYGCFYEVLEPYKNLTAVWYRCYKDDADSINEMMKSNGFNNTTLPFYEGTVIDYIENLKSFIDESNLKIKNIDDECKSKTNELPKLKKYVDYLLSKKELNNTSYLGTEELYVLFGWVPEKDIEDLKNILDNTNCPYDIEFTDPKDDDIVPTYTVNDKFVSPFESITNMFSVPNWKELDPNPVMSVWYWFLFGMMVGDVGYGIVMLVAGLLFIKFAKPVKGTLNIAKIIVYSSLPTILWGILFNSYFGAELTFYKAVISPMQDAIGMLILSVGVGLLHLVTGLVMKAIRNIKEKQIEEMLGKNLSWILVLLGLALMAASMFVETLAFMKIPSFVMIGLGVLLILIFAGHEKKSIIGRGLAGILGLYDATSFLGDILSYSRIMALVMSSASVAYVMNTLAGMVAGETFGVGTILSIPIYIVGHAFNLVLGLLSAYVHDCRLQYIEFYGKFFDGGGIEFKPLSLKTKYIKEIKK